MDQTKESRGADVAATPKRRKRVRKVAVHVSTDGDIEVRHMKLLDAPAVALADDALGTGKQRVWNQIAKVGQFRGHAAGPFELTPQTFAEIVRNFDSTANRHIPVDFEHASELQASEGSIPAHGAPATGWVTQLENRGAQGLWGLFEWHEPARSYIKDGRYKFLSPAIRFRSRDRVTGEPVGARLTSVGLTNSPFLDGLQPVAARHIEGSDHQDDGAAPPVAQHDDGANGATTMTDAIRMRDLETQNDKLSLQLKDAEARATAAETELKTLRDWRAQREDQDVRAVVATAFDTYKDQRQLTDANRESMLRLARADMEAFQEVFPPVAAHQQHLMRRLAGDRTQGAPAATMGATTAPRGVRTVRMNDASGQGAPVRETIITMADRLQRENPKMTREEAFFQADIAMRQRVARFT